MNHSLQHTFAEMVEAHQRDIGLPVQRITITDAELTANDTADRMIALVKARVKENNG